MRISFTSDGWTDYISWEDRKVLRRINRLIEEAARDAGVGAGKPERLRGELSGFWSRRIDQEHRLVYQVQTNELIVVQARHHY